MSSYGGSNRSSGSSSNHSLAPQRVPTALTIPDPNSVEELGRTYQGYKEGKYYLPNDGEEQDRLDVQHKCWELMLNGDLYWAPIGKPTSVLDIGTGTGIWAINFAKMHPQATVIGTDLSLMQPVDAAPPNCTFIRDDIEDDWVFDRPFDYVHLRMMVTCFDDPRGVLQRIYDNLQPGGWVEYHDHAFEIVGSDPSSEAFTQASAVARLLELMKQGMWNAKKRDLAVPRRYKTWMREMGFVNVVERPLLVPVNSWPVDPADKLLGQFSRMTMEKVIDSSVKMLIAAGLKQEEVPEFLQSCKWSVGHAHLRAYYINYAIYGQKPHETSPGEAQVQSEATPPSRVS